MKKFNPEKELYKIKYGKRDKIILGIIFLLVISLIGSTFALYQVRHSKRIIYTTVEDFSKDIQLAVFVDGVKKDDFPTKNNNIVYTKISCDDSNVTASWNYEKWGLELFSKLPNKCNVYFETRWKDSSGAAYPELYQGMVPITIGTNGELKVADLTKEWYDYNKHNWANAVLLDNNKLKDNSPNHAIVTNMGADIANGEANLDGVNDYIDCGFTNYDFGDKFSLIIKFKMSKMVANSRIISNTENGGISFYVTSDNKLLYSFHNGTNYTTITTEQVFKINEWYELAAIFNGESIKIYVNGNLDSSYTFSTPVKLKKSPLPISIGSERDGSKYYYFANMSVSKAKIYHRDLNNTEVNNIYQNQDIENPDDELLLDLDFTKEYYPEYKTDETINMNDIAQMYVWIPRYRYKLWNVLNGNSDPQAINIEFENNTKARSMGQIKGEWFTHPAFLFGDTELNGFWVGKFEPSEKDKGTIGIINGTENAEIKNITILPNKVSSTNHSISIAFNATQKIASDGQYNLNPKEVDTHMMKNMEWGAVAYLSQSKYGIFDITNDKVTCAIDSTMTEQTCRVWLNNTSHGAEEKVYDGTITGCSGNSVDAALKYNVSACETGRTWEQAGVKASTTGNVYGVYDMAGGTWTAVMGNMADTNGNFQNSLAGFETTINSKYYDLYAYDASNTTHNRGHLGDATREILKNYGQSNNGGWHDDAMDFPGSSNQWFYRGGFAGSSTPGIFALSRGQGYANAAHTFGVVITAQDGED